MSEKKTVKGILAEYLKTNGFDGLCGDSCGCSLDNFMPCTNWDGNGHNCNPAYKVRRKCSDCKTQCDGYDGDNETDCYTTEKPEVNDEHPK